MSFFFGRFLKVLSLGAVMVSSAYAANPRVSVRPTARIVGKIDNTKVTAIKGSHPASVANFTDTGRLDPSTPMRRMTLVLKSSDEQEYALVSLLDQQQKTTHANYHQWMTPETFGATFGVESSDVAQITGWLKSAGFSIDKVANSARMIQFSGNSGQVEKAFRTEMHSYKVNGEQRVSNATDISIPSALAPVVRGIAKLNNFRPKQGAPTQLGMRDPDGTMHAAAPGGANPLFTNPTVPVSGTAGAHYIGGADYAALYDTAPLLAKGINGTGVSIGVVEDSDINTSDVALYRSIFGLPVNQITVIHDGPDTGIITFDDITIGNADVMGATDVEVAGAVAPMASLYYVTTGSTVFDYSAADDSAAYLVDNNLTDIIVMSFVADETDSAVGEFNGNGVVYPPYYENGDVQYFQILWEQAAAQGQSVFVTAGETGPSAYDEYYAAWEDGDAAPIASSTYSVNSYASTPFNVAVGSTELNEGATYYSITGANPYWAAAATAPPYATALGYIPENTWNQSTTGTINGGTIPGATGLYAGGGGVSAYSPLPNWQSYPANSSLGIPGISLTTDPAVPTGFGAYPSGYLTNTPGPHRLLPDVSMASGTAHDGAIVCYEGNCTLTAAGLLNGFGLVASTTASTASMAGIQALINQSQAQANATACTAAGLTTSQCGRQGNPNFYYYAIAKLQEPNAASCNASTYPLTNTANTTMCGFHDVTVGTNQITTKNGSTTSQIGWTATPGYDLTTGLGSPDAANLVALWPVAAATFLPTTVGFNILDFTNPYTQVQPILISHNDDVNMSINVYPVDSTGYPTQNPNLPIPTGDVGIIAVTADQGGVGFYNISAGGCANYGGPTVPITGFSVAQTGSVSLGYLYTITFTGNVSLGANVGGTSSMIGAGTYVLLTGLPGQLAVLNNTYQYVTASTGTTFQIQVGNPPVSLTLPLALTPVTATITAFSIANNVVTVTAANTFAAGASVTLSGLTTSLNGGAYTVLSAGLSATQFEVALSATTLGIPTTTVTGATASLILGTGIPYVPSFNGSPLPSPAPCGGYAGDGDVYDALNNGALMMSGNFPGLPGGSYNVYAHYTGDTIYAGSNSQPIAVIVSPETTTMEVDAYAVNNAGTDTGPGITSLAYGQNLYLDGYVLNSSGFGTPTGTVTYSVAKNGVALPSLTTPLDTSDDAQFLAGSGFECDLDFVADCVPNYPVLNAGTYTISATYNGDPSFVPAVSPTFTIVVTPVVETPTFTAAAAEIAASASATLFFSMANAAPAKTYGNGYTGSLATGTVTFADTTVATAPVALGSCTLAANAASPPAAACTVTTATGLITTTGAHTITATFTDTDGNYASTTKTTTVTVISGTTTTITLAAPVPSGTSFQVGATSSVVATLSSATAAGTLYLYANGVEIANATATAAKATTLTVPATLVPGTYALTANFAGSTTVDASAMSAPVTLVQLPNTPTLTMTAPPTGDIGTGYSIESKVTMNPNNQGKGTLTAPFPNLAISFSELTGAGATIPLGTATAGIVPTGDALIANLITTAVVPGPGTITATYIGDANYTTTTATEAINIGLTTSTLSIVTPSTAGTVGTGSITLQAVVTPQVNTMTVFCKPLTTTPTVTYPTTCGTVAFYDSGVTPAKLLGTVEALPPSSAVPTVAANPYTTTGVATLTVALPTAPTHTLYAVYSGDTHFYTSTAAPANLIGLIPSTAGFTIAVNPTSLSIAQGSSGAVSVTATVFGNWAGQAPLVCTGLPANSYCTFSYIPNIPPSTGVPLSYFTLPGANGALYTGTLTITTEQPHAVKGVGASGLLWLPALMLAGLLGLRRKQLTLRGRQLLVLAILLCGSLATTACSSLGMATPTGASTVTVIANGAGSTSASPGTQATTTFTLTVTP